MWLNLLVDHYYFWLYHKIDHNLKEKNKKPTGAPFHPNEIQTRFRIQFVLTQAGYERTEAGTDGSFLLVQAGT